MILSSPDLDYMRPVTWDNGDLYMIYMLTQRDGIDFQLASIPDEFERRPEEPFDMDYMNELYELGYRMALKGYPWVDEPPGWRIEKYAEKIPIFVFGSC